MEHIHWDGNTKEYKWRRIRLWLERTKMGIKTEIIDGKVRTTCSECGEVIMSINHICNPFKKLKRTPKA